jgi:hypothetical protein
MTRKTFTIAALVLTMAAVFGAGEAQAGYWTTICNAFGCYPYYVVTCNYFGCG